MQGKRAFSPAQAATPPAAQRPEWLLRCCCESPMCRTCYLRSSRLDRPLTRVLGHHLAACTLPDAPPPSTGLKSPSCCSSCIRQLGIARASRGKQHAFSPMGPCSSSHAQF